MFGGCREEYYFENLNDVWEFDLRGLENGVFKAPATRLRTVGDLPDARWGHSAAVYEGKMYIFGGRNHDDLNDIYSFDFEERRWARVDTTCNPEPRRRHSAAFIGRTMVMFGGFDGNFFNDFSMINVEAFGSGQSSNTF